VFPQVLQRLNELRAVHEVQEGTGILHLDSRFYHNDLGLTEGASAAMEVLIA